VVVTRKNSLDSKDAVLLDALIRKYEDTSAKVQSHKKVINAYGNISDISAVPEIVSARQNHLLIALDQLASAGEKALSECMATIQKLEGVNRDLIAENSRICSDFERLKLEFQRQIGVLPKAMRSNQKKGQQDQNSSNSNTADGAAKKNPKAKKRGAPKGHRGKTRTVPSKIDAKISQSPSRCNCGCDKVTATDQYDTKYIEDILPVCCHVTKIEYQRGFCTRCGALVRHKDAIHGPPVSIGPNLSAHLVMLRQMGVTYRKLAYFCTETLGIPLSPSGALGVVNRSAEILRPANKEIFSALREQTVLNADETGWPVANKSAYVWGFFNTSLAYFHADKSRGAKVPKAILGEDFKGTVLCDFYAAYNFLQKKQRCWIHLLRDIETERKVLPGSASLEKFETRTWDLVTKGIEISKMGDSTKKTKAIIRFNKALLSISKMKLPKGKASTLAKRIAKHYQDLARFLTEPGVEYHNNRAERQLRPLVIARKNSYGSNTSMGAERNCIINSVVETCRLNDIRPIDWLKQVFTVPDAVSPSLFHKK
jgi:hypothetical protein